MYRRVLDVTIMDGHVRSVSDISAEMAKIRAPPSLSFPAKRISSFTLAKEMTRWGKAIDACIANGGRILDDAIYLEEYGRLPSARALAILAQEEFAKAYLLRLVDEGAIPLCNEVLRACRDHACKHLIGLIMLYLYTPVEDWLARINMPVSKVGPLLPSHVADALNIFCHEKLRRWRSKNWIWVEDVSYDAVADSISKGELDRKKQDNLYVGIGKKGITSIPHCTACETSEAIDTAKALKEVAEGNDVFAFSEKDYINTALREMLYELKKKTATQAASTTPIARSEM